MANELTSKLIQSITDLSEWCKTLIVTSQEEKQNSVNVIGQVKTRRAEIIDFFKDTKEKSYAAWKAIVAQEKGYTDKLDEIERTIKNAIIKYDNEEAQKREAERRRLQAIADEQARKERERLLKQAEKLKTPEKKEALMEAAAAVQGATIIMSEPEKTDGASTRKIWKAKVTDITIVPREWMMVNDKALDVFAKSTKGSVKVPGVEFYEESNITIRR